MRTDCLGPVIELQSLILRCLRVFSTRVVKLGFHSVKVPKAQEQNSGNTPNVVCHVDQTLIKELFSLEKLSKDSFEFCEFFGVRLPVCLSSSVRCLFPHYVFVESFHLQSDAGPDSLQDAFADYELIALLRALVVEVPQCMPCLLVIRSLAQVSLEHFQVFRKGFLLETLGFRVVRKILRLTALHCR